MKRILLLLSALAMVACVNEKNELKVQGGRFTFTAGFSDDAGPVSKVILDQNVINDNLYVFWESGDEVSVFDGENNGRFVSDRTGLSTELVLDEGEAFVENEGNYYALFPYDADADFTEEGYVITTLPAVQYARKDAFSFHRAVATATQNDKNFSFKNVTAVFKANITTEGVESIVFKGNKAEVVAGQIKVKYSDATYEVQQGMGATTVTVHPPSGMDAFEPGVYYFTILPQTFNAGFTITINLGEGQDPIVRQVNERAIIPRSSLSLGRPIGTEGSGSVDEPYLIQNKYDFEGIATTVADDEIEDSTTTYISIMKDIDLGSIEKWRPINNVRHVSRIAKLFVEGNDHIISNFAPAEFASGQILAGDVVEDSGKDQHSLFGIIRGTVQNLTIINAELERGSSTSTVGILAGWIGFEGLETSYVKNVSVSGTVSGNKAVGGLSGMARNAVITGCTSDVTVTASGEHASGLVARYYENVSLSDCHASGTVNGIRGVGGILGFNETKSKTDTIFVDGCSSTCSINANYQVGGLVGHSQSPISIQRSWVKARVKASAVLKDKKVSPARQVGGIIGVAAEQAYASISQSYYKGDISADGKFIGGVMGYATGKANIQDCHACCNIENTGSYFKRNSKNYDMIGVGGILGGSLDSLNITHCFVDEGNISTCAHGTLTSDILSELDWDGWVDYVKRGEVKSPYLGGGVGGVVGFIATQTPVIQQNITFITNISCARTSSLDAPCAPIVGCLPKAAKQPSDASNTTHLHENRSYRNPQDSEQLLTIDDEIIGVYVPLAVGNVTTVALRDNVINALSEGQNINQYCMYARQVNSTANSAADTWKWTKSIWNYSNGSSKPYLKVHESVYNQN